MSQTAISSSIYDECIQLSGSIIQDVVEHPSLYTTAIAWAGSFFPLALTTTLADSCSDTNVLKNVCIDYNFRDLYL